MLIGAAATILGNIKIGKNAMVAAGSLVLKPVPRNTMVAGSPAKEIGCMTGMTLPAASSSGFVLTLNPKQGVDEGEATHLNTDNNKAVTNMFSSDAFLQATRL